MRKQFNFDALIKKYSVECQLLLEAAGKDGKWTAGNWIPGTAPPSVMIRGAVVPMSDRKVYQSGGAYTEHDREFITKTEISMEQPAYIIYQGDHYKVEPNMDYSDYAGFFDYNLKRVDAFDRPGKD